MKTDRELLELAAKSAGITINTARQAMRDAYCAGLGDRTHLRAYLGLWTTTATNWNPLADEGDALRLAVECSLTIDLSEEKVLVEAPWLTNEFSEDYENDKMRATRRAIVRAAAAIGEQMP